MTLALVVATTLIMGTNTKPLLKYLGLAKDAGAQPTAVGSAMGLDPLSMNDMSSPIHNSLLYDVPMEGLALDVGGLVLPPSKSGIYGWWRDVDAN